ncbi:unnamed protein product [Symbiodinium natans]|uniref:Hint domain-containing protein n=1 Tax=Symbiodinium natans TaxID=878477 RepID=A0A812QLD7_9DINO|nr:unnamed protein product [Symbiodinium natans]
MSVTHREVFKASWHPLLPFRLLAMFLRIGERSAKCYSDDYAKLVTEYVEAFKKLERLRKNRESKLGELQQQFSAAEDSQEQLLRVLWSNCQPAKRQKTSSMPRHWQLFLDTAREEMEACSFAEMQDGESCMKLAAYVWATLLSELQPMYSSPAPWYAWRRAFTALRQKRCGDGEACGDRLMKQQQELETLRAENADLKRQRGIPAPEDARSGIPDGSAGSVSSILSQDSWFSVHPSRTNGEPGCFMLDAIFKTRRYGMDFFMMGKDLLAGSEVVAADDRTMLRVAKAPEVRNGSHVVDLCAGDALLQVTPDHRIVTCDPAQNCKDLRRAGSLQPGDIVVLSGEPVALTSVETRSEQCKVLRIVFQPDLPVATYSLAPSMWSQGHPRSCTRRGGMRRGGMRRRGQPGTGGAALAATDSRSIPGTAPGEYSE